MYFLFLVISVFGYEHIVLTKTTQNRTVLLLKKVELEKKLDHSDDSTGQMITTDNQGPKLRK